ncbi:hypothetical protein [Paenibacillus chitinolyticus]|uniref:hypothetical protein n=1 Tax=Paenibacillus chitinolyticus TaxID=79263 RepID=UPI00365FA93F
MCRRSVPDGSVEKSTPEPDLSPAGEEALGELKAEDAQEKDIVSYLYAYSYPSSFMGYGFYWYDWKRR